jgi:hypothetical protein
MNINDVKLSDFPRSVFSVYTLTGWDDEVLLYIPAANKIVWASRLGGKEDSDNFDEFHAVAKVDNTGLLIPVQPYKVNIPGSIIAFKLKKPFTFLSQLKDSRPPLLPEKTSRPLDPYKTVLLLHWTVMAISAAIIAATVAVPLFNLKVPQQQPQPSTHVAPAGS